MSKKPRLRLVTAALFLAPVFLLASQPWSHPNPQKWTAADIQRILVASPWAQEAGVTFGVKFADDAPAPPPLPGAREAGLPGAPDPNGRWDGGVGSPDRYRIPTLNVLVRWDSALPERLAAAQATKTGKSNAAGFTSDQMQQYYIVTVVGLVPGGRYTGVGRTETQSSSDDAADTRNPEQMLEQMMAYSRLATRSLTIHAADAKLNAASGDLHLFFPRQPAIKESDKEVVFETRFGSVSLVKKFRLKDMVYGGKLEL